VVRKALVEARIVKQRKDDRTEVSGGRSRNHSQAVGRKRAESHCPHQNRMNQSESCRLMRGRGQGACSQTC